MRNYLYEFVRWSFIIVTTSLLGTTRFATSLIYLYIPSISRVIVYLREE
jgi:hypothetical protein